MTKQEAIEAMKAGAKVTHRYFEPEEWITMEGNLTIITEEGYACSTVEFWNDRKSVEWETDWSIWTGQVSNSGQNLIKNKMDWTEPQPPTQGISYYDHVICQTPLGQALIEWKGWKESDSYSLTIDNDYVGEGLDLDDAKRLAKEWLTKKHKQLSVFLGL